MREIRFQKTLSGFKTRNSRTRIFSGLTRTGPALKIFGFLAGSCKTNCHLGLEPERPNPDPNPNFAIPNYNNLIIINFFQVYNNFFKKSKSSSPTQAQSLHFLSSGLVHRLENVKAQAQALNLPTLSTTFAIHHFTLK